MMLEYQQDAKAYPLVRPAPNPGMTMAEMAVRDGQSPKARRCVPKTGIAAKLEKARKTKKAMMLEYLRENPRQTRHQLAAFAGLSPNTVSDYMRQMQRDDLVISDKVGGSMFYEATG